MNRHSAFLRPAEDNMVVLRPAVNLEENKASTAECCKPISSYQYHNCYGLPYQDHNYGAPPPPTPPQSPGKGLLPTCVTALNPADAKPTSGFGGETGAAGAASAAADCAAAAKISPGSSPGCSSGSSTAAGGVTCSRSSGTPTEDVGAVPASASADDSVTRCICDYSHDDGYMICCDECSVWQHIDCMGISRDKIPDTYLCEECSPRKVNRQRARLLQKRKQDELTGCSGVGTVVSNGASDSSAAAVSRGGDARLQHCRRRRQQQQRNHQQQPPQQVAQGRSSRLNGSGDGLSATVTVAAAAVAAGGCSAPADAAAAAPSSESRQQLTTSIDAVRSAPERKSARLSSTPVKQAAPAAVTPPAGVGGSSGGGSVLAAVAMPATSCSSNGRSRRDSVRRRSRPQSAAVEPAISVELSVSARRKRSSRSADTISNDDDSVVIDPCGLSSDVPSNHYDADVEELLLCKKPEDFGRLQLDEKSLANARAAWSVRSLPYGRKCLETLSLVRADTVLLTYQGRFMRHDQFVIENPEASSRCSTAALFFNYGGTELCVVPALGEAGGCEARFVRRSCTPTAEVRVASLNGKFCLAIVASQELSRGSEITIPFDGHAEICDSSCECACGRGSACSLRRGCSRRLRRKAASGSSSSGIGKDIVADGDVKTERVAADSSCTIETVTAVVDVSKREKHDALRIAIPGAIPAVAHGAFSPTLEGAPAGPDAHADQPSGDVLSPGSCDKAKVVLSREERKMAAIVKVFEKLEKREERRKEALARLELSRKSGGHQQQLPPQVQPTVATSAADSRQQQQQPLLPLHGSPVKAAKVEREGDSAGHHAGGRRFSATGSAADRAKETRRSRRVSEPHFAASENLDCGSNRCSAPDGFNPAAERGGCGSSEAVASAVSAVAAAAPAGGPVGAALQFPIAEIGSTCHGTLSPNYARLHKTKKHLLSEWYHEIGCDKLLAVHTGEAVPEDGAQVRRCSTLSPSGGDPAGLVTVPVVSPSFGSGPPPNSAIPQHPAAEAMLWSPPSGTPGRLSCGTAMAASTTGTASDCSSSMGSAKKRWLRQAMNEGGDRSPDCGGLLSPATGAHATHLPPAPAAASLAVCRALLGATPGVPAATSSLSGSATSDGVPGPGGPASAVGHPLGDSVAPPPKKRRLARESISVDEQNSLPSPGASTWVHVAVPAGGAADAVVSSHSQPPSPMVVHRDDPLLRFELPGSDGNAFGSVSNGGDGSSSSAARSMMVTLAPSGPIAGSADAELSPTIIVDRQAVCGCDHSDRPLLGHDRDPLGGAEKPASSACDSSAAARCDCRHEPSEHRWVHQNCDACVTNGCVDVVAIPVVSGLDFGGDGSGCIGVAVAEHLDGLGTPAKKKVSLLEYRKRMRAESVCRDGDDSCHSAGQQQQPQQQQPDSSASPSSPPPAHPMLIRQPSLAHFNGLVASAAADDQHVEQRTPAAVDAQKNPFGSRSRSCSIDSNNTGSNSIGSNSIGSNSIGSNNIGSNSSCSNCSGQQRQPSRSLQRQQPELAETDASRLRSSRSPPRLPPLRPPPQRDVLGVERKPVSLDERLRLEFGLDAEDESRDGDIASTCSPVGPQTDTVVVAADTAGFAGTDLSHGLPEVDTRLRSLASSLSSSSSAALAEGQCDAADQPSPLPPGRRWPLTPGATRISDEPRFEKPIDCDGSSRGLAAVHEHVGR